MGKKLEESVFKELVLNSKTLEELIQLIDDKIFNHDILGSLEYQINAIEILKDIDSQITVNEVFVGDYNNHQILYYSVIILEQIDRFIFNLEKNEDLSLVGKQEQLSTLIDSCFQKVQYFNSMNDIRYANYVNFNVRFNNIDTPIPVWYLKTSETQKHYINKAFNLRRDLYQEILNKLYNSHEKLDRKLVKQSKYRLIGSEPHYDLMEIYLSLTLGNKVQYLDGDAQSFLNDLSKLLGVEIERKGDIEGKILQRKKPARFLDQLADILETKSNKQNLAENKVKIRNKKK